MTTSPTTHRLSVPGAELCYDVRGSGPLLLVVGQPMTGEHFGPMADLLAHDHTVVTYDPRGLGRSTVSDPSLAITPDVQADDLAQLVEAVGGGPAEVFGTSGGAVTGLALATRHPGLVSTLVAHEPPVAELLPDAVHVRAAVDGVEDAYRAAGSGAGWGKFISLVVHQGPVPATGVPDAAWPPAGPDEAGPASEDSPPEPSAERQAGDELFFLRMLKPFTRYRPAVSALSSGRPTVVVAVGEQSHQEVARRATDALAEQLGTPTRTFPGDHASFLADPAGFAEALREVLAPL